MKDDVKIVQGPPSVDVDGYFFLSSLSLLSNIALTLLVDCPTQLICTWIFICVPWQSYKKTAGNSARTDGRDRHD